MKTTTSIDSEKMRIATPIDSEKIWLATPIDNDISYAYRVKLAIPIE